MEKERIADLIEAADMNALLRVVDGLCTQRDWEELLDLADRCEEAVERGKQLWPIAAHVDYRLALEAPADYAAGVLESGATRFTLGPLTEVAASTHTWDELAPHIDVPHVAAYVAQERVLRGEDLTGDERAHADVLELPLRILEFEPTYALATYRSNLVEVAEPWDPKAPLEPVARTEGAARLEEPEIESALVQLVHQWTSESNGAADAIVIEGSALDAVSALTFDGLGMGRISSEEAMQRMAWAASGGGAHGRRRGAAFGRMQAWHVAALLCDLPWPPPHDEMARVLNDLNWYRWDEGAPEEGWVLRLAVEDLDNGWAAAIGATDLLQEEEA